MSALSDNSRLSPDDRYELAARSVMQERRSRPAHLVTFGFLVLVCSLLALAIAWKHNSSANKKLVNNQITSINAERMILQISELKAAQSQSTGHDQYAPIPDILTRLTRIGAQVGLDSELGLPKNTAPVTKGGTRLMAYPYTVRDPSLERILQWIQRSQEQIPGLQIREITINLNSVTWLVKVTLTRYERIE